MKRLICLAAVCAMLLCGNASAAAGIYADVPLDADYADAVEVLSDAKIIQGYADGNFYPDKTITRAQAATMICRLLDVEEEAKSIKKSVFSDVPTSYWAAGCIAKAAELGIINGYQDGSFKPDNTLTYAQIVKMVVCANGLKSLAEEAGGYPSGYLNIANEWGYTYGINIDTNAGAPRKTVAVLFYNTLGGY